MSSPRCQRRHERDRRCPAADHDDPFVPVVEVLRPVLGMDDRSVKPLRTLKGRREAFVIAVVAGRSEQPRGAQHDLLACVTAMDPHDPLPIGRRPVRVQHLVMEPNMPVDAVLARCLGDVGLDRGPVSNRLVAVPGLEVIGLGVISMSVAGNACTHNGRCPVNEPVTLRRPNPLDSIACSGRRARLPSALRAAPVDAFEQHGQLRRAQRDRAGIGLWPDETAMLESFRHQAQSVAVAP